MRTSVKGSVGTAISVAVFVVATWWALAGEANFTWSPVSGIEVGETVQFTDASTVPDARDWEWTFFDYRCVDGSKTMQSFKRYERNPSFVWEQKSGASGHSVTLKFFDSTGHFYSVTKRVDVDAPSPVCSFSFSPERPEVGEPVRFWDTSSAADPFCFSFFDRFGDGEEHYGLEYTHVFDVASSYEIRHVIQDATGQQVASFAVVVVGPSDPCDGNSAPSSPVNSLGTLGLEDYDLRDDGVWLEPSLAWTTTDPESDPILSDVYFAPSPTPPLACPDVSGSAWHPPLLEYETTYSWRIVAKDTCHPTGTTSSTWSFTTPSRPGVTLTLQVSGCGSTSPAAGRRSFGLGEEVTVRALESDGCKFISWEGDYRSTRNPFSFRIDSDTQLTAVFEASPEEAALSIIVVGCGTTIPSEGTHTYSIGESVTLQGVETDTCSFVSWEGDLDGSENPVTVAMDGDRAITAVFEDQSVDQGENGPVAHLEVDEGASPPCEGNSPPWVRLLEPTNDSDDVEYHPVFKWSAGDLEDDPLEFDLYLSTSLEGLYEESATPVATIDASREWTPSPTQALLHEMDYYWRIEARDGCHLSHSQELYHFRTKPSAPIDLSGADTTDLALLYLLSLWLEESIVVRSSYERFLIEVIDDLKSASLYRVPIAIGIVDLALFLAGPPGWVALAGIGGGVVGGIVVGHLYEITIEAAEAELAAIDRGERQDFQGYHVRPLFSSLDSVLARAVVEIDAAFLGRLLEPCPESPLFSVFTQITGLSFVEAWLESSPTAALSPDHANLLKVLDVLKGMSTGDVAVWADALGWANATNHYFVTKGAYEGFGDAASRFRNLMAGRANVIRQLVGCSSR